MAQTDAASTARPEQRGRLRIAGWATAALLPYRSIRVRPALPGSVVAGVFTVFVFLQNLSTLPAAEMRLPDRFVAVRQTLGLYQNWTMFAPHPEMNSPWPVIAGRLQDGTAVDVYNRRIGAPVWDKPHHVSNVYANYRWRRYLSNLEDLSYDDGLPDFGLNYGRYLCRLWNRDALPGRHLATFEIAFDVEWSPPDNRTKDVVRRLVWNHDCFG